MTKPFQLILLLGLYNTVVAQDTLPNKAGATRPVPVSDKNKRYPVFRPLTINYDVIGDHAVTANTKQSELGRGNVTANTRIRLNAAMPVYMRKGFTASVSFSYAHLAANISPLNSNSVGRQSVNPDNFALGIHGLYRDSLWNRPVIYSASVLAETRSFNGIQKWSGLLSASLVLKQTTTRIITLGLAGIIDPSSPFPVFPSFTYWQRMANSPWELQVILPARVMFKRSNTAGGWLSVGTELQGTRFFSSGANLSSGNDYVFQSAELISSIGFERHLSSFLFAGVKAGWRTGLNSRVLEVNAKNNDYLLRNTAASAPYASFTLSVLIPR